MLITQRHLRYFYYYYMNSSIDNSLKIYLRIRKEKISWLKFILEGYDGLAMLSTISGKEGLVTIWTTLSGLKPLFSLLNDLAEELSTFTTLPYTEIEINN